MYVSPEELAAKAEVAQKTKEKLPAEVIDLLTLRIEDGARRGWRFKSGSSTNEGVLRQGHADEDSVFVLELSRFYQAQPESLGVYVVADGMGGQAAGEVASRNAITGLAKIILTELALPWMSGQVFESQGLAEILHKAALEAHTYVRNWNMEQAKDSGSTLTMACLLGEEAVFANVGDSRTYLFRRGEEVVAEEPATIKIELTDTAPKPSLENGRRSTDKLKFKGEVRNPELTRPAEEVEEQILEANAAANEAYHAIRVTRDDSLVQQLMENGVITIDEVYSDPRRNVVLNGLGTSDETIPVSTYHRKLRPGDHIVLCSDGLWEMVRDPALAEIVTNNVADVQLCADEMVTLACRNGGADNVSVVVVAVEH
jgi:serine/threonine protein phosphatase PrpC